MQTLYQLPDSLWQKVRTIIEPRPRRRKHSLQLILSGIFYLLQNGCKWRSLPPQYGDYWLVWYYPNRWAVYGVLDQVLQELGFALRRKRLRGFNISIGPSLGYNSHSFEKRAERMEYSPTLARRMSELGFNSEFIFGYRVTTGYEFKITPKLFIGARLDVANYNNGDSNTVLAAKFEWAFY